MKRIILIPILLIANLICSPSFGQDKVDVTYPKVGEIEFTFNMNSNGEKDSLTVLSGGREFICPKLDD